MKLFLEAVFILMAAGLCVLGARCTKVFFGLSGWGPERLLSGLAALGALFWLYLTVDMLVLAYSVIP